MYTHTHRYIYIYIPYIHRYIDIQNLEFISNILQEFPGLVGQKGRRFFWPQEMDRRAKAKEEKVGAPWPRE